MKKLLTFVGGLAIVLSSCQDIGGYFKGDKMTAEDSSAAKADIYERDMSITAANSYSDLFLDSAAVENYISRNGLSDTVARSIRNFYNVRNYQYAWFSSDGFTEQGRGFWNLYDYHEDRSNMTKMNDSMQKRIDTLLTEDTLTVNTSDSSFVQTELALTQQFIHYAKSNGDSSLINAGAMAFYVPARKADPLQLADSLLNKQKDSSFYAGNQSYLLLKNQLRKYYDVAQKGGWQPIPAGVKNLRKGTTSPAVAAIKKRLQLTGEWNGSDTSNVYNDSLEVAIKSYQQRHGFKPDGIITDSLVQVMNVPAAERVEQILVNMNRTLWMPKELPENAIEVNIPAFMLTAYEGKTKKFDMPVVVGKEGTNTMMFTGDLNQIVFSPYWNIPVSIVRDEIMPAMKTDPNYLKKRNMEIVKQNDSIPVIRQLPGAQNSLGEVKFLFPNSYEIYFHDTPNKELFDNKNRAVSHGCIRLADAQKMAEHLLHNDKGWTPEKIKAAMNSNKEQYVKLDKPVPVVITYLTAWVDEAGQMNFRDDIYRHDESTTQKMFTTATYTNTNINNGSTDSLKHQDSSKRAQP